MAQQTIDIGTVANDGTGDPIRDAFDKCNDNFTELYTGLTGLLDFKGSTDCSANPNYPAASKGDYYLVSVAGKIGGASGVVVGVGDSYFAIADNAGGTQAGVGTSWTVVEGNIGYAPVNKAGDTMTGDLVVPDEAYDATAWNGSLEVPTKNAVRDKIESLSIGGAITAKDEGSNLTTALASLDFVGAGVVATNSGGDVTVTIAGGSGYTSEDARDDIGAALVAGTGITITVNDPSDTITIARADLGALHLQDQRPASSAGGTFTSGAWQPRVLDTAVVNTISGATHVSSTVTITIASPGVVTWNSHGLANGTPIVLTTTGALPTGLTASTPPSAVTIYYVINAAANTFQLAATSGGAAINTTGSQSGTHTATSNQFTLPAGTYEIIASAPAIQVDNHQTRLQNITDASTALLGTSAHSRSTSTSDGSSDSHVRGRFTIAGTKQFELQHRCSSTLATAGMGTASSAAWGTSVFADVLIRRIS